MRIKTFIFILFFFNSIFAEAQERWEEIDTTELIAWDTFELEPGFDFCDLRIDLLRPKEWEKIFSTNEGRWSSNPADPMAPPIYHGSTNKKVSKYHTLGVHLGNGLFFDLKGNLSFFMPEIWGLSYENDFEIEVPDGEKHADLHMWVDQKYRFKSSRKIKQIAELTTAKRDTSSNEIVFYKSRKIKKRIISLPEKIELQFEKKKLKSIVEKNGIGNRVDMKIDRISFDTNQEVIKKDPYTLNLNHEFALSHKGKFIFINKRIKLARTKEFIYILKRDKVKTKLKIEKDAIRLFVRDELKASYYLF